MHPEAANVAHATRNKGLILILLTIAMFMVVIDFSIVQIALPTIKDQFNVPLSEVQWIVTGYSLTYAGFLMLSGRAGDIYGRKKLFIAGLVLFSLASLAGGLAPSLITLILARIIQGVGAAIGSATGLSIMMTTFKEGPERNKALSVFSAILSSGFAVGVLLGGVMTATLGWRSVLLVNVPIGIVAAFLCLRYLPESVHESTTRNLDLPGAITITTGLILLVYALTNTQTSGFFTIPTFSLIMLSLLIIVLFFFIESRSKAPLMPISFLRRKTMLSANSMAMILTATVGSLIFAQTIFLQQVLNYSPLYTGLLFLPQAVIFAITSGYLSSRLANRFGARKVASAGMVLTAIGFLVLTTISISGGYLYGLLPGMVLTSLGAGTAWTSINIIALEGAKKGEEGLASGLFNTSIQVGGPLGLAMLLTIVAAQTQPGSIQSLASIVTGFQYAFLFAAVLVAIAVAISVFTKTKRVAVEATIDADIEVPAAPPGMAEPGMIPKNEEE